MLLTPEVRDLYHGISKFLCRKFIYCQLYWKDEKKKKSMGMARLKKTCHPYPSRKRMRSYQLYPVWPDWAIYWTLGKFKPLATINLPKSPIFLGIFCEGVKIYHFSSEIIFIDIWRFFLVTLAVSASSPVTNNISRISRYWMCPKKFISVKARSDLRNLQAYCIYTVGRRVFYLPAFFACIKNWPTLLHFLHA